MLNDKIEKAIALAKNAGYVIVATSDEHSKPHVCAAGQIEMVDSECVAVTEWFCPGTIANIDKNRSISIVSWDRDTDDGYQLIGTVGKSLDMGVLDGYSPSHEMNHNIPQIEKRLIIDIEKVMVFRMGPHTDEEITE